MLWSSARPLGLRMRRLVGTTCSQLPQVSCSWRYCSHHPNLLITSYLLLKPSAEVFSPNLGGPRLRSFIFFFFCFCFSLSLVCLFYLHPNMGVTGVGQLEPRPQFGHHPQWDAVTVPDVRGSGFGVDHAPCTNTSGQEAPAVLGGRGDQIGQ